MPRLKCMEYTVGWISALPLELAAATAMMDEEHQKPLDLKPDGNHYRFGGIAGHNIVMACLPSGGYGTNNAAIVATSMMHTFGGLRIKLMVGIGGGVPGPLQDIRLGDVVVSLEVLQHDLGKTMAGGEFVPTGLSIRPSPDILTALADLQATHKMRGSRISALVAEALARNPAMKRRYSCPGADNDRLFTHDYDHASNASGCDACNPNQLVRRKPREGDAPEIHYGRIASGNQVIKDGATREKLRQRFNMLCFEMEAAGLMDNFRCLVVRGICDYADSHKNKRWQEYAAATAAGYTKEFLLATEPPAYDTDPAMRSNGALNHTYSIETHPFSARSVAQLARPPPEVARWDPEDHGLLWAARSAKSAVKPQLEASANLAHNTVEHQFRPHGSPTPAPGIAKPNIYRAVAQLPDLDMLRLNSNPGHTVAVPNTCGFGEEIVGKNEAHEPPRAFKGSGFAGLAYGFHPDPVSGPLLVLNIQLLKAAERGDARGVRKALSKGADPNFKDESWGKSPLHYAARNGHKEIVRTLIAAVADKGHTEAVRRLLDNRDKTGRVALDEAAENGHPDVVRVFVEYNYYSETALQLAQAKGHSKVMALLFLCYYDCFIQKATDDAG